MIVYHRGNAQVVCGRERGAHVLVLGESPTSRGEVPLRGSWARKRLVADHGHEGEADDWFDVANVLDRPTRRAGKGREFPVDEAMGALNVNVLLRYDRVVTLGRAFFAVRKALVERKYDDVTGLEERVFIDRDPTWCGVARFGETRFLRFPHPSGVNHYWNEPTLRAWTYRCYRAFVGMTVGPGPAELPTRVPAKRSGEDVEVVERVSSCEVRTRPKEEER